MTLHLGLTIFFEHVNVEVEKLLGLEGIHVSGEEMQAKGSPKAVKVRYAMTRGGVYWQQQLVCDFQVQDRAVPARQ
ncbi:hypothetical protein ACEQ8H_007916 [Pleosporales sp. CAS-2024a]